jgi:hypothetical protein
VWSWVSTAWTSSCKTHSNSICWNKTTVLLLYPLHIFAVQYNNTMYLLCVKHNLKF